MGDKRRVAHVWLYNPKSKKIVLQKRSLSKKISPGKYDISCAKYLREDEELVGIVRPLKQELNIEVEYKDIFFDKKYLSPKNSANDGVDFDQEAYRYFMEYDTIENIIPNREEIDGIYEFDIDDMINLTRGNIVSAMGVGKQYVEGELRDNVKVYVTLPEIVPKTEDYYEYSFYRAREFVDIYDSKLRRIGIVSKDEAHKKGLMHITFHCWIIKKKQEDIYMVLQKRVKSKGGTYDISAAGHMQSGEGKEDGLRELEEELGVKIRYDNLIDLGLKYSYSESDGKINKEISNVYLLDDARDINDYILQKEEVDGMIEIEINDGMRFFSGETGEIRVVGYDIDEDGYRVHVDKMCTYDNFMQHPKNYYLKICIMAERYYEGKKYLCI